MYLKIDNFTDFELNIKRTNMNASSWDDRWCAISLKIKNEYFSYNVTEDELLLESEIEEIITKFNMLLNGEIEKEQTLEFLEPDLVFILRPYNDDCLVDLRINLFIEGALSADYYNLCLDKNDIREILKYLNNIIPVLEKVDGKDIEEKTYCLALIKYEDSTNDKVFSYILDGENKIQAKVYDTVLVDRAGIEVLGTIQDIIYCTKKNAPYPIEKTKKVIKIMQIDLEEYLNKNVEIIDVNGFIWNGRMIGYTPAMDTDDEKFDEINIEVHSSTKGEIFKEKIIVFPSNEIKSIREENK